MSRKFSEGNRKEKGTRECVGDVSHVGTYDEAQIECYSIHVGERLGTHRAGGTLGMSRIRV